ncbi:MAG: HAMP domain-containing protein [Gammaproteobacteria bacterium]|nr:MAG: HAMP domain-containing protein [Gammaproteobacteria bacterium]
MGTQRITTQTITSKRSGLYPRIVIFVLLLFSLYLMSSATQNSDRFSHMYLWLIVINVGLGLLLTSLVIYNFYRLARQYRKKVVGTRLTIRLVIICVILSIVPVSMVFYFSSKFLTQSIDSWFDVEVEGALKNSIELSRSSLNLRTRDLLHRVEAGAKIMESIPEELAALTLNDIRQEIKSSELSIYGKNARIVASSSDDPTDFIPHSPSQSVLSQVRNGSPFIGIDPVEEKGIHIRIMVPINKQSAESEQWALYALFPVPEHINTLAEDISIAFDTYNQLTYMRGPLKTSFMLTLSLVLGLSVLASIWAAFYAARRFIAPVTVLIDGTQAISTGDYSRQLPSVGEGELGFLVKSFNDMTRKIAQARDDANYSQQQVERQKAYLETVLGHLRSGVLTINADYLVRTANSSAEDILKIEINKILEERIDTISNHYPFLDAFVEMLVRNITGVQEDWSEQVTYLGPQGKQIIMCHGVSIPGGLSGRNGYVIVFDDITSIVQAQRDSAWGEVARRLAHEIKNPLTPIQLATERLRLKYLNKLPDQDVELFDRATNTIISQVDTMKEMVNEFADYARSPANKPTKVHIEAIVSEVLDLFISANHEIDFVFDCEDNLPMVWADSSRMRQIFNNLIRNGVESMLSTPADDAKCNRLEIKTSTFEKNEQMFIHFGILDSGPGFATGVLEHIFEPYVTTKEKGTGLGMPIVKKIVEEHGGKIYAKNRPEGGAEISINLPIQDLDESGVTQQ